jgi:putative pyruvate formate lyase activating enzyme
MLPAYREQLSLSELKHRADSLHELLRHCTVCPRECGADRLGKRYGVCRATDVVLVSGASPHFGEEPPLVGSHGSGTIFLTSCNLKCAFCQNYDISHQRHGWETSISDLARLMLMVQELGCHNVNFVTPTHYTPQIAKALVHAVDHGFSLPIVYNCGGYESVATLQLLEGIVDIYMPDIKYSDESHARRYSGAPHYWETARAAVAEMHRQVGDLRVDSRGIAERGLLIRHLVLPNRIAGSRTVLEFIARDLSTDSYVNIMDQYHPSHHAGRYPELNRRITSQEDHEVVGYATRLGLRRGF